MADTYNQSSGELLGVKGKYYKAVTKSKIMQEHGVFKVLQVDKAAVRNGDHVVLSRYAELADNDTPITNEYTRNDLQELKSGQKETIIYTLNNNVAITETAKLTTLDGCEEVADIVKRNAHNSVERYLAKNMVAKSLMIRADLDANYQYMGLSTSAGASDGTTIICTGLTAADDYWNGALVTLLDVEFNILGSRYVSDWDQSDAKLTFSTPWEYQIASGVMFQICHFTGIVAGDSLALNNMREANIMLFGTGRYGNDWEVGAGGYNMVLDGFNYGDMLGNSDLVAMFKTKESEKAIRDFHIKGHIMGFAVSITNRPYRCAVGGAGTYARSGICDIALIIGKGSASRMPLDKTDVEIIHHDKTRGGLSDPAELIETTSWKHRLAVADYDPAGRVGIICGQTRAA